jgi:iron complex outermembrane receptor protein
MKYFLKIIWSANIVLKKLYCNQLQNKQNQTQLIMKNCIIIINFTQRFFLHKKMSRCCKDNTGNPLPGVNIIEKRNQNGVSTDSDGSYKIKVKTLL